MYVMIRIYDPLAILSEYRRRKLVLSVLHVYPSDSRGSRQGFDSHAVYYFNYFIDNKTDGLSAIECCYPILHWKHIGSRIWCACKRANCTRKLI